ETLNRFPEFFLVGGLQQAVGPAAQHLVAGDDGDGQLLVVTHLLDLPADVRVAVGEVRHGVRVEQDHSPAASRRARMLASCSSTSASSWKTPKCLSTACFDPRLAEGRSVAGILRRIRCSSIWNRSSQKGWSNIHGGGNLQNSRGRWGPNRSHSITARFRKR